MNIGIFGLWGMNIPGIAHGGFESIFTEVGARLAERGHRVTIYCRRKRYPEALRLKSYRGVRLIYSNSIETKSLSTPSGTLHAVLNSVFKENYDVYFFVNVGMGLHCSLAKLFGKKVALNVDGLDWQRSKWNWLGRTYFRIASRAAMMTCDRLITDSKAIQKYYLENFKKKILYIPYGTDIRVSEQVSLLKKYGIKPLDYYFIASRFVPENNIDLLIEAFKSSGMKRKLLVAGSTNYDNEYQRRLLTFQDQNVIFLGHIHDQTLFDELLCNCYAYLHGHSVGGTNPVLLRALGCGSCILALDTPFNAEVLEGSGILFKQNISDLCNKIQYIENHPQIAQEYRIHAKRRIHNKYSWNNCTDGYEKLFQGMIN